MSSHRFSIQPLALSFLQLEIRSCSPNMFAKRCLLAGSLQAVSAPFANQGVKDSAIDASWHTHMRRSVMRAEAERRRNTWWGFKWSQSGAFTCRVLRNVRGKSCKAFVQFVTTDDCTTADVQHDLTCTAVLNKKKGLWHFPIWFILSIKRKCLWSFENLSWLTEIQYGARSDLTCEYWQWFCPLITQHHTPLLQIVAVSTLNYH